MNRPQEARKNDGGDGLAELESQFILRLPSEHAKILRELIQSGANNLKDRLSIRIENDMRSGEVRLDHLLLHAKVMDLPTIIESLKTIDNKTFYKTADICQIVVCKEDDEPTTTDEETASKAKKKDPNKVDKKYLYPHGVTPPLKNVRKRRFRKTLKKKYAEAPEIEKEVRRLLRVDNEAVSVKWEVINEDEDKNKVIKEEPGLIHPTKIKKEPESVDVAEHDIFGGAVSDSEDETNINIMEMEETSRLSADSSRMSDPQSQQNSSATNTPTKFPNSSSSRQNFVTEFSKDMFPRKSGGQLFDDIKREPVYGDEPIVTKESLKERLTNLERELEELKTKRVQQENEVANIENMALRQRFQDILDNLLSEQMQKEQEYNEVRHMYQKMIRDKP